MKNKAVNGLRMNDLLSQAAGILEKRLYPEVPSWEILREKYELPDEFGIKILSFPRNINSRRSRKTIKLIIVAAALISLLIAFSLCMGAKEGGLFYMNTFDVKLMHGSNIFTRISGEEGEEVEEHDEVLSQVYVPKGYELDKNYSGLPGEKRYISDKGFYILMFSQGSSTYAADTENNDLRMIQIKDSIVYYCEDEENGYIFMTGHMPAGNISIRGNISFQDGIKIIESVIDAC